MKIKILNFLIIQFKDEINKYFIYYKFKYLSLSKKFNKQIFLI